MTLRNSVSLRILTAGLVLAGCLLLANDLLAATAPPGIPAPPANRILATLNKAHPRLLASQADFDRLKERLATDANLRKWHESLASQGRSILTQAPSRYEIPDGLRLLATSRRVLERVYTLALLYRLDGDKRYAERAWKELQTAAEFKDWNNRHFLDTAEMTHAFAIGYDWLYDYWTPEQRTTLQTAMVEKGIKPALQIENERRWWAVVRHNWNQVCNGGIGMGALALGDAEPDLAGQFLHAAVESIQLPMAEYGPDGAWAEGPGYWHYATTYNVTFLAALQTALGTDFGLSKIPGFSEAGTFPIYASGPTGLSFSYADCHAGIIRAPAMFWLAREFQRPEFESYQLALARGEAMDLVWYDPALAAAASPPPVLDKYYRHSEVATFRSAWQDRNALFVGFKAGDNKANHSHLDLGSFILDALGHRWGEDIGSDDYNLPGYFGGQRWNYYRLRAEGHNTLVVNPDAKPDQEPRAFTPINRFESKPDRAFAITDLSAAYPSASRVQRGVAMLDRRQVLVQDEVHLPKPGEVWWFFHTPAAVKVAADGTSAELTIGQEHLGVRLLASNGCKFTVMPAEPLPTSPQPPKQAVNRGVTKLALHAQGVTDLTWAVAFVPLSGGSAAPPLPKVVPLAEW